MKKVLLAAALLLGGSQLAFSAGYDENTYYNNRYAFKVSYPALTDSNRYKGIAFELGEESDSGDGNGMYNQADGAGITAYGMYSGLTDPQGDEDVDESGMVIGCTLKNMLLSNDDPEYGENINVVYKRQIGDTAIYSGTKEGDIYYKKAIYANSGEHKRCLFLDISYPISEKEKYDAVVKRVAESFVPTEVVVGWD